MVGEAREWQKRKMTVHEARRTHSRPRATHRGATHGNRPHRLPPRLKCCAEETSIETDLSPAYRGLKKHWFMDKSIQTASGDGRTAGTEEPGGGDSPHSCRSPAGRLLSLNPLPSRQVEDAGRRRVNRAPTRSYPTELGPPPPQGAHRVTRLGPRGTQRQPHFFYDKTF